MFKHFLLGLVVGLALGVAVTLILNTASSQREQMGIPDTVYVDYHDEELKESLKELPAAISKLNLYLQSTSSTAYTRPLPSEKEMGSDAKEPVELQKDWKKHTDWAQTLDKDMVRALIENAKTPYDPEVIPILNDTAKKLHDLEMAKERAYNEYNRRRESVDSKNPEYRNIEESIYTEYKERIRICSEDRARIIGEFFSALQSLE